MNYWTYEQFKKTREKINPVSKWWGKKAKDSRPVVYQYIDAKVNFLANETRTCEVNFDFTNM